MTGAVIPFLRAIAGPLKGAVFQLVTPEVTIGRQSTNHLCIGDRSVSRQHCIIERGDEGFRVRNLSTINGTVVNGKKVDDCPLSHGDKIRVGDTIFLFLQEEERTRSLSIPDNGVVANSCVEGPRSETAETAIWRLFDGSVHDSEFSKRARSLLMIGARLQSSHEPEALEAEILKQLLEATPADTAAIVLLAPNPLGEPLITGWDRKAAGPAPVAVSRTLVTTALAQNTAIFTDDVTMSEEFSGLSSLNLRKVDSVIVVPLAAEGDLIGTLYLESVHSGNRLGRQHLEFAAVVAEYAGKALDLARRVKALKDENRRLQRALQLEHSLVGGSLPMQHVSERIARIAQTDATVLIRGETGTGKELAARAIHQNSARAGKAFEAINCALLSDTLLQSELFGHERGAFTGAVALKKGKLEMADGGTVFLDELGSLGEASQAMLLRVLQNREFQRLGGTRTLTADIRVIAATNENLEEAIQKKTFRQDLYYRLNVVSLTMPPLRERRDDIPLLADHFVQTYSRKNKRVVTGISSQALARLQAHDWPGNVRELENVIEHAIVFGATEDVLPEDLPETLLASKEGSAALPYHEAVREAKRKIVLSAMQNASGDFGQASQQLGIHVNNLHRLIRELELKPLLAAAASSSQTRS
ncbi:MAG TPA: sigma 54-interacting transcriptional regulator [Bryobacteraceae bacterium]|nr:sigma 54-interacting transcriptional regulator [Bryobacteraceae bacterium]